MLIYYIILFFLTIGFIFDLVKIKWRKYIFKINFIVLYIFSSIRYMKISDYVVYKKLFENSKPLFEINSEYLKNNPDKLEIGYRLLESFIKTFTNNYFIFIALFNIVMFYFLYLGMKQYPNRNIQLFIYYCFIYLIYSNVVLRQGLVMCIFYYNIINIKERRLKKYIFWCIVSFFFHSVSLVLIPIYFLVNKFYSKKKYLIVLVLSFIIAKSFMVGDIILFLKNNLDSNLITRIYIYYFIKSGGKMSQISLIAYLQRTMLGIVLIYFKDKQKNYLNNLLFLAPITFLVFSNIGVIAGRISSVFLITYIPYFSTLLDNLNLKKIFLIIYLFIYSILFFTKELLTEHPISHKKVFIPYETIFCKNK